jgi:Flp pilus assembly protein TadG
MRQAIISRRERGQSLVELTLGFLALSVILMGMLDIGRLYFTYIAVEDAAGEAALFLAVRPNCYDSSDNAVCGANNTAIARAQNATGGLLALDWSDTDHNYVEVWYDGVQYDDPPVAAVGRSIEVQITYRYEFMTPLLSLGFLDLTASAQQIMVTE